MRSDRYKTKTQLVEEITQLRKQVGLLERKESVHESTEDALARSGANYRALVEDVEDLIFMLGTDGKVLSVNPSAARLLGRDAADIAGHSVTSLFPAGLGERFWKNAREVIDTGTPRTQEGNLTAGSREIWISTSLNPVRHPSGEIVAVIGVSRDVSARRRAEEALRVSEDRFRMAFDLGPFGVSMASLDSRFTHANQQFCKMMGYSEHELRSLTIADLTHPDYVADSREGMTKLIDGEIPVFQTEKKYIRKDKEHIWGATTVVVIRDPEGKPLHTLATIEDITERKRMGDALKSSEVRYRRLFETAQDAILILDGDTGQIIDASPFIKDLLGYSMEELRGKNLWEIGELKDALASKITYQRLSESGHVRYDNLPLVTKDLRPISVEVVANAYEVDRTRVIQCNIRDMTERNIAMSSLKVANEDLRVAQRLTNIGDWKWNVATNKVTWSEELCRINGWDPSLPVPPFAEMARFYTTESWERLGGLVTRALNTGESYSLETDQIRTDGTTIRTLARGEVDRDSGGNIVGLHGTIQDVTERKLAEEELNLRAGLLDNANDSIFLHDFEGKFIYVNDTACKVHGYSRDELLGMTLLDLDVPESADLIEPRMKRLQEMGGAAFEVQHVCKDGTLIPMDVKASVVESRGRKLIMGACRDATERRQAQMALQLSEENFRHSMEDSPLGIRIVTGNGETVFANRAVLEIYGFSSLEELKSTHVTRRYTPESLAEFRVRRERRRQGLPTPSEYEVSIIRKDKDIRHLRVIRKEVLWNGERLFQVLYNDVTERKQAEEALKESERALREAQRLGRIGNWEFDPVTQSIRWSDEVYDLYERDRALGPPSYEEEATYYTPEEAARLRGFTQQVIATGQGQDYDLEARLPSGKVVIFRATTRPEKDEAGRLVKLFGTVQDITERKSAEEKLRQLEVLKEMDRMRAEFLANVSHELKTPLTAIKGYTSSLLRDDVQWKEEQRTDFLQTIDEETDRLTRLINDLLDMSRLDAKAMLMRKASHTVRSVVGAIQRRLESLAAHHRLEVAIPDGLPPVYVDDMRIGQVISNLVDNAVKHSPEGSTITVAAEGQDDGVVFRVQDRGGGIPPEYLERVFDRFVQADEMVEGRKGGTGLGLSISRSIVEDHGGSIWVESKLKEGSTFSFNVPFGQEA